MKPRVPLYMGDYTCVPKCVCDIKFIKTLSLYASILYVVRMYLHDITYGTYYYYHYTWLSRMAVYVILVYCNNCFATIMCPAARTRVKRKTNPKQIAIYNTFRGLVSCCFFIPYNIYKRDMRFRRVCTGKSHRQIFPVRSNNVFYTNCPSSDARIRTQQCL